MGDPEQHGHLRRSGLLQEACEWLPGGLQLRPRKDVVLDGGVVDVEAEVLEQVVPLDVQHPVVGRRREADADGAVGRLRLLGLCGGGSVLAAIRRPHGLEQRDLLVDEEVVDLVHQHHRARRQADAAAQAGVDALHGDVVLICHRPDRGHVEVVQAPIAEGHDELVPGRLPRLAEHEHDGGDDPRLAVPGRHAPDLSGGGGVLQVEGQGGRRVGDGDLVVVDGEAHVVEGALAPADPAAASLVHGALEDPAGLAPASAMEVAPNALQPGRGLVDVVEHAPLPVALHLLLASLL